MTDSFTAFGQATGTSSGTVAAGDDPRLRRFDWSAADHNLLGWSCDPAIVNSQTVLSTAGRSEFARLHLPVAAPVTNVLLYVGTAGATLTAGQCFAALHGPTGTLIGQTADQAAAWASTGVKTMALAGGPYALAAADYIVEFWFNGTTGPAIGRAVGGGVGNAAFLNVGLASPSLRCGTANTGLTTTAPGTLGTQTASTNPWWVALS